MPDEKRDEAMDKILEGLGTSTPLGEAMSGMHEMYLSLRAGGFKENEALKIIAYAMLGVGTGEEGT